MKRKHIILIIMVSVLAALSVATSLLKSISGKIVDVETGKPIEGAAVLAEWTRRAGIGDYHTVSVRVGETATDKDGKFWILGLLYPFVDPVDVTVYKKGYVAWNNRFIFPDYAHRKQFDSIYGQIQLERFKEKYSFDRHVDFIRLCTRSAFASYKKRMFAESYAWEIDLALKEIKKN